VEEFAYGRFAPKKRTFSCAAPTAAWRHKRSHPPQQIAKLFDHLVGACEQRIWDGYFQRSGRFKIDKELDLCRLLDGEFSRVCALKYFVYENGRTPTHCNLV
jgi:hypothetical protein